MVHNADMSTVPEVLASAASPQPLLTFYDDATGERTELSGVTLGNWVAKTANLLTDGYALGPGDTALVALPVHWQSAAVLLGCWSAGLRVVTGGPADIAFAASPEEADAADRLLVGLHPLGLPLRSEPPGWADYLAEVRTYGDHFAPRVTGADPATGELTQAGLVDAAGAWAVELGIAAGDRLLVDVDTHPEPLDWLLAPLVAGASTVLCRNLAEDLAFYGRVRRGFLEMAERDPRFAVLDSAGPVAATEEQMGRILGRIFGEDRD